MSRATPLPEPESALKRATRLSSATAAGSPVATNCSTSACVPVSAAAAALRTALPPAFQADTAFPRGVSGREGRWGMSPVAAVAA